MGDRVGPSAIQLGTRPPPPQLTKGLASYRSRPSGLGGAPRPGHEAEPPDRPVPRPSGLPTATRPHGSAGEGGAGASFGVGVCTRESGAWGRGRGGGGTVPYRGGGIFARGEFRGENFTVKKGGEILA